MTRVFGGARTFLTYALVSLRTGPLSPLTQVWAIALMPATSECRASRRRLPRGPGGGISRRCGAAATC